MTINGQFEPDNDPDRKSWHKPRFRSCIPDQISAEEFQRLLMEGRIVDGRCGGVILGKNADEGGPRGIFKIGGDYLIQGRFSGGDFVMNHEAAIRNLKRLRAMNAGTTMRETVPDDPCDECGMLLVTTAYPDDRLLWLDFAQAVIERAPAQKHLIELMKMNQSVNPYLSLNLHEILGCDPGTADGIV